MSINLNLVDLENFKNVLPNITKSSKFKRDYYHITSIIQKLIYLLDF